MKGTISPLPLGEGLIRECLLCAAESLCGDVGARTTAALDAKAKKALACDDMLLPSGSDSTTDETDFSACSDSAALVPSMSSQRVQVLPA